MAYLDYDGLEYLKGKLDNTYETIADANDLKSQIKYGLEPFNSYDILLKNNSLASSGTTNGVTYTFNTAKNKCLVTGTTSALSFRNIYVDTQNLPVGVSAGDVLQVKYSTTNTKVRLAMFFYDSGGSQIGLTTYVAWDREVEVPSNAVGCIWRLNVDNGQSNLNLTVSYAILNAKTNLELQNSLSSLTEVSCFLASTGDTTDRKSEIEAMLSTYGVCRLGKGMFYTTTIDMPDGSSLIGCGEGSFIRPANNSTYGIKMGQKCTIENLTVRGAGSNISINSTVSNRHAILWQGDFTDTGSYNTQPQYGMINNVRIERFTGGGITCTDTGPGTFCHLEVSNVVIANCNAGINISYYSEYHKFTNVRAYGCYYGCINNGGNNVFVNCDFSTSILGFLMDNSSNQSPNNAHGSAIGCLFNHQNSNTGEGIRILDCASGFMFVGCQLFYAKVYLDGAAGIVFSGCNFGSSNNDITISEGGAILFSNNMFGSSPTITVTNNSNVHFDNCYVASTGASVAP